MVGVSGDGELTILQQALHGCCVPYSMQEGGHASKA